jgi:hypothetical protein
MKTNLFLALALALPATADPAQAKPVIVVNIFTAAPEVVWPYDMKVMQAQTVAEFNVELGKEFDILAEPPGTPAGSVFTLDVRILAWRKGNAAKRVIVGLGSGRESADIHYRLIDSSGKTVIDRKDTIRTNFYSQGAGSVGTLVHPIAVKMADRISEAKLK